MSNNGHNSTCFHCGDPCDDLSISLEDKHFCCNGCKTVFEILNDNDLCNYYDLENAPGISLKESKQQRFEYLDHEEIIEQLIDFQDDETIKVTLYLPQIHCSSCLWLIENLYRLNEFVVQSRVNFVKKEASFTIKRVGLSLRGLVEILAKLGYEPNINLQQTEGEKRKISRKLIYQVGLAGFAFGNIMLMSLPEYFGLDDASYQTFSPWFSWLNLLLALPVTIYSGQDYFRSAFISLKNKRLNIDVPIAIGVLVLFIQSCYEIISKTGAGYFDSLCGLLFFLLLGRIFQEKTYHQLSFERDYKSYFPISVTKINENGLEESTPIQHIKKGDRIIIRNGEIIPVDAILISAEAKIDNSFATGESKLIDKHSGDKIFAGGRHNGKMITIEAINKLKQSKLTSLWNDHQFEKTNSGTFSDLTNQISQYFTPIIFIVGIASALYHYYFSDLSSAISIFSAVMIVACPCALALAAPFAFGHASRFLGRHELYLRNSHVVEDLAKINHIVFDKTGTLTFSRQAAVTYAGEHLNTNEQAIFRSIFNQSTHPLSKQILQSMEILKSVNLDQFEELKGKGMKAIFNGDQYFIGSADWLAPNLSMDAQSIVVLKKNKDILGHYTINNEYRYGLKSLIQAFKSNYGLSVLTGDSDNQKQALTSLFGEKSDLNFNQSPEEKLKYIEALQNQDKKVMMVGDGLNDAGALNQSHVGLAVAEDTNSFSPACDAILDAKKFDKLSGFLKFTHQTKSIVIASFIISFLYNIVGLSFAVQGKLSPVFAAILMPLSSITVVGFVSISTYFFARKI